MAPRKNKPTAPVLESGLQSPAEETEPVPANKTSRDRGIPDTAGAGLAGTGIGSIVAVFISVLPEHDYSELKKALQLAIPSITGLLSAASLLILRYFIAPYIENRPLNKVLDRAKKIYKEACKDPDATEEDKRKKKVRVEKLEELLLDRMRDQAVHDNEAALNRRTTTA